MIALQPTASARPRLCDYIANRPRGVPLLNHERVANLARNHSPFMYRMNMMKKLPVHNGCVNTICWNKTGEYLLSGSDDCNLCITKPTCMFDTSEDYTVLHKVQTLHQGNIFSAQFLPNSNDSLIVSCSSHGPVIVHDINLTEVSQGIVSFNCHASTIFEVVTLQDDDKVFLTCGEDKTVRLFDLRCHRGCSRAGTCPHPPLIRNSYAMTTLKVHPTNSNLLLVGRADGLGLVYDRRKLPDTSKFSREKAHLKYMAGSQPSFRYLHPLEGVVSQFTVPGMEEKRRFTSLSYSANGRQVLASYSQEYIYLFDHDKSSNFQLIQTLPKNYDSNQRVVNGNNSETSGDATAASTTATSTASSESAQTNQSQQRTPRTPRIRVRGDWSDTGVNSVPLLERGADYLTSQLNLHPSGQESIIRHLSQVVGSTLGSRSGSGAPRFVPLTELIAGPLEYGGSRRSRNNPSESTNSNTAQNESQSSNAAEEEQQLQDEDDEDDDDDDDDLMEVEDLDPTETVRLHVNLECDDEDDSDELEEAESEIGRRGSSNCQSRARENEDEQTNHVSEVSSKSKQKFKESFADLKNKFSKIPTHNPRVKYQGHRNCKTSFKEAIFWGDDYIMSGSDCGRIMVWEKETAKLVMAFQADERVVNCLAPNPHQYVLASSGIDYDIKLWSTQNILDCPLKVSQRELDGIIRNNELMLYEARETLTVPPHLFFRVLASFAQNRLN